MVEYKFISENTIEYLSLHDCQCSRLYYADTTLIFEMEWMEVLATHPNNPFDKSYQSTEGKIILLNPVVELGILLTDASQRDESMNNIEDVDISDFVNPTFGIALILSTAYIGALSSNQDTSVSSLNITFEEEYMILI